jgi:hypothetical protein
METGFEIAVQGGYCLPLLAVVGLFAAVSSSDGVQILLFCSTIFLYFFSMQIIHRRTSPNLATDHKIK